MARGVGLQSKHIPVTVGRLTEKYKNNKIQKEEKHGNWKTQNSHIHKIGISKPIRK